MPPCTRSLFLGLLASLTLAGAAHAEGTALFSWNVPAGPHDCASQVLDVAPQPGTTASCGVVATGLVSAYHGYDVTIDLSPLFMGAFPDAWRFDASGCDGAGLQVAFLPPPVENGCADVGAQAVRSADWTRAYDAVGGMLRIQTSVRWTPAVAAPDPQRQYLLFAVTFDFTDAVPGPAAPGACGGLDVPMCLRLARARMVRPDDTTWDLYPSPPGISANAALAGGPYACGDLPARAPTWGAIKAQYR